MVHGIKPNDTKDCPTFPEVWNDVVPLLNNRIIVAHNASFDMYALKDAFKVWHIDYPSIEYYCSYRAWIVRMILSTAGFASGIANNG